jgi:hypothetical protein
MPTCCAGSAASAAIRPASTPSCAPTCRRMSRKASSHLEAVADRDPFGKAWTLDHPDENGERSLCHRISRVCPPHFAGMALVLRKSRQNLRVFRFGNPILCKPQRMGHPPGNVGQRGGGGLAFVRTLRRPGRIHMDAVSLQSASIYRRLLPDLS